MKQKYRDALDRIERDCETMQTHGGECFATRLLDLAVTFYVEKEIKNKCFTYLIATDQMLKYHESDENELREVITKGAIADE